MILKQHSIELSELLPLMAVLRVRGNTIVLIFLQELSEVEKLTNSNRTCGDLVDECRSDHPLENSTKDFGGLTDIYWVSFFPFLVS